MAEWTRLAAAERDFAEAAACFSSWDGCDSRARGDCSKAADRVERISIRSSTDPLFSHGA
jgi:hypothetical protein